MVRARLFIFAIAIATILFAGFTTASAHSVTIEEPFTLDGVMEVNGDSLLHEDADDWKGFLTITVMNNGTEDWGDFHFQLFDAGYGTDTVYFADEDQIIGSSQDGWYIISEDGLTLDFYFYGDPISTGETATFTIYTDNTAEPHVSIFGISFFATPVPAPGALLLLCSGLIPLLGRLRRYIG